MSKPKLTPWFPGHIKPVHVGVYPTRLLANDEGRVIDDGFAHWDGKFWGSNYDTPEEAAEAAQPPGYQNKPWRGLAEQPK